MGYIPLGAVFGFLFSQAGGEWWLAVLASIIVYAGASQYMMIPMLVAGASIGSIAAATLVINLRHVFYGVSLLNRMPGRFLHRWYTVFGLTDETYSLLTTMAGPEAQRHMTAVALLNQCWWVLGTAVGAIVGAGAQLSWVGLDFALIALFAVLAVEQWRGRRTSAPLWVALVAYGLAYPLAAKHALGIAIGLSLIAGAIWPLPAADAPDQVPVSAPEVPNER